MRKATLFLMLLSAGSVLAREGCGSLQRWDPERGDRLATIGAFESPDMLGPAGFPLAAGARRPRFLVGPEHAQSLAEGASVRVLAPSGRLVRIVGRGTVQGRWNVADGPMAGEGVYVEIEALCRGFREVRDPGRFLALIQQDLHLRAARFVEPED
jgi:hypothetical protein